MLRYLLEFEGYRVREARDGVEAMQVLAAEQISVLITDLYMPRMNGFELLRLVQSAGTVPRLVAMSGVVDYEVRPSAAEAALLLATHAILDKPFTIQQLIQAIAAPETAEAVPPPAVR
jgi:CheY-like chemotaxis protein